MPRRQTTNWLINLKVSKIERRKNNRYSSRTISFKNNNRKMILTKIRNINKELNRKWISLQTYLIINCKKIIKLYHFKKHRKC